jgi:hypothetical protein
MPFDLSANFPLQQDLESQLQSMSLRSRTLQTRRSSEARSFGAWVKVIQSLLLLISLDSSQLA